MVSANDKGKKPVEDDPQNPKEEEILVGDEEDMKEEVSWYCRRVRHGGVLTVRV